MNLRDGGRPTTPQSMAGLELFTHHLRSLSFGRSIYGVTFKAKKINLDCPLGEKCGPPIRLFKPVGRLYPVEEGESQL